jgi:uncharacterized protein with NRDE domain
MHPDYWLILAANRDEYHIRPTLPLGYWNDFPGVLAGRDLKSMGTWLGLTRTGRISAITNYRDPKSHKENAPSRGRLVSDYLCGETPPPAYLEHLEALAQQYNGFNLLVGDRSGLYYYSNRKGRITTLKPGLYGLSNHLLDTPWPKVEKGKAGMQVLLDNSQSNQPENIFELLSDRSRPPDDRLPDTGVGLEMERMLSPLFIASDVYGTRSSSIVFLERNGMATFIERTFTVFGEEIADQKTVSFRLKISP